MLLSEAGYDQGRHDAGVEAIRQQNLPITDAIKALAALYKNLYGIGDHEINSGMCGDFAQDLKSLFPEAVADWGDTFCNENDDLEKYAYHCIVFYNGKYYDSVHPEGVKDFREMETFKDS